jgi:hypothetical protein
MSDVDVCSTASTSVNQRVERIYAHVCAYTYAYMEYRHAHIACILLTGRRIDSMIV